MFAAAAQRGRLQTLVHPAARHGALGIHSDAALLAMRLDPGDAPVSHALARGRKAYVHLEDDVLTVNGQRLLGGDALKLDDETEVSFEHGQSAHVLLFDLGNPAS
jgi:redox-sensitive bicupin YhaK (pirin superfamily)